VKIRELIEASGRFALHAAELGFIHPTTKERMMFKVGWPADLHPLVEQLEFDRT
jgi:23S rRNA pseudouridine1911/1915/1917 synthase